MYNIININHQCPCPSFFTKIYISESSNVKSKTSKKVATAPPQNNHKNNNNNVGPTSTQKIDPIAEETPNKTENAEKTAAAEVEIKIEDTEEASKPEVDIAEGQLEVTEGR